MSIKFPDGDQDFRSRLVQTQTASKTSVASTNATNYSDTGLSKSISIQSVISVEGLNPPLAA